MDKLIEILPALGSATAAVVVVVIFVKHMHTKDAAEGKRIQALATSCHDHQGRSQDAFEKNLGTIVDLHKGALDKYSDSTTEIVGSLQEMAKEARMNTDAIRGEIRELK